MRPRTRLLCLAVGLSVGLAALANPPVHRSQHTVTGQQIVLRADAPSLSPVTGARGLYVLHCAGCHGLDGQGAYSARVPDLRRMGHFLRLPGGRDFLTRVPGVLGSGLDDAQVAQVLNWMLDGMARATRPADTPLFTALEIDQARASPLADVMAQRRRLVALADEHQLALEAPAPSSVAPIAPAAPASFQGQ
jgi:mono/diheme cytochrome c family protein